MSVKKKIENVEKGGTAIVIKFSFMCYENVIILLINIVREMMSREKQFL